MGFHQHRPKGLSPAVPDGEPSSASLKQLHEAKHMSEDVNNHRERTQTDWEKTLASHLTGFLNRVYAETSNNNSNKNKTYN